MATQVMEQRGGEVLPVGEIPWPQRGFVGLSLLGLPMLALAATGLGLTWLVLSLVAGT